MLRLGLVQHRAPGAHCGCTSGRLAAVPEAEAACDPGLCVAAAWQEGEESPRGPPHQGPKRPLSAPLPPGSLPGPTGPQSSLLWKAVTQAWLFPFAVLFGANISKYHLVSALHILCDFVLRTL